MTTSRTALAALIAASASSLACKSESVAKASPPPSSAPTAEGHFCNLGVFTPIEWERHKELVPKLAAATTGQIELADGYEFVFSGHFKEAGEWLDGVRRCCPTVRYDVAFEPRAGVAKLRITGTNGAKDFIRAEFDRLFPKGG
jgi:hypothetical protein